MKLRLMDQSVFNCQVSCFIQVCGCTLINVYSQIEIHTLFELFNQNDLFQSLKVFLYFHSMTPLIEMSLFGMSKFSISLTRCLDIIPELLSVSLRNFLVCLQNCLLNILKISRFSYAKLVIHLKTFSN